VKDKDFSPSFFHIFDILWKVLVTEIFLLPYVFSTSDVPTLVLVWVAAVNESVLGNFFVVLAFEKVTYLQHSGIISSREGGKFHMQELSGSKN